MNLDNWKTGRSKEKLNGWGKLGGAGSDRGQVLDKT
jgi:hypothetical protein